jgi:hypothetical protein
MKMRTPAALLAATILATACANASTVPGDGGGTAGGRIDHPSGAGDLLLRVSYEGGFMPVEYSLTAMPIFSLFGDGATVAPGAQTEIYPGPALPPLITTPVTEDGIQALLRDAIVARLDEDREYTDLGSVMVADAATTVFTLSVDGVAHVTRVYAMGMLGGDRPESMSDEEFAARTRLERFQASLQDLRGTLPEGSVGEDTPFAPSGLRLFVSEYRGDGDLKQPAAEWPLSTPLSSFGDPASVEGYACGAVTGADLETLLPLAQTANQLTPWRSEGSRYAIVFRPLLPDESGC